MPRADAHDRPDVDGRGVLAAFSEQTEIRMRRRQFARHQRIVPTFAQIEEGHAAEQPALLAKTRMLSLSWR
jgi:hypothetical protein